MSKKRVIFICHGNICRSPMAHFIFLDEIKRRGLEDEYEVDSYAVSYEEEGNDIYPPMKRALYNKEIPFYQHKAKRLTPIDYEEADYIFYMDSSNKHLLDMLLDDHSQKLHPIYEFTPSITTIDDPWYTGQFDDVVEQLQQCCDDILYNLKDLK